MKTLCFLLLPILLTAQIPASNGQGGNAGGGGGGGSAICTVTGSQTSGYVLTATDNASGCAWQTVGGASVSADTIKNAWYLTDTGTANAVTGTTATTYPGAYATGQTVIFKAAATNTTATTININSLGVKNVTKAGATALSAGNKVIGVNYLAIYDGTEFQLVGYTAVAADVPALSQATTVNSISCALNATCTVQVPVSTGITGLGTGIATWLSTPTSANLLAAMTTKTGTGSVVFGTAPTLSGVTMSDITGSTQCLHVNTIGLVTGTGSDCGGGGGSGTVNSGTSGHIGYYATSSTAISSDSNLDDGATTANTLTYAGVGGISSPAFISTGSTAGLVQLGQGTANTTGTNTIGIQAPTSIATSYVLTYPGANPSGGQAISFGTPSSGVSTGSWITPMTTSTSVQASQMPALTGDVTSSAGAVATTVNKVNGIAYSATAAAHSVEVVTTANTTATAKVLPDCVDTGGNHLNYTQSTDAFSCGTSGGGGGSATTFWQSDSDNVAGSGTSTNSTTLWSVYIKTPVTFGTIATVLSVATGADSCDLGIYNASGTLQAHWGATAITGGVVFQSHTISGGGTVTLNPAWYEVAFTCTSTSQMFVGSALYFTQFAGGSNPTSGNSTSGGALNASIGVPATSRTNLYRVPSISMF